MRRSALLCFGLWSVLPGVAHALKEPLAESAVTYVPDVSAELVDPQVHSRFHLLSAFTFADASGVFSDSALAGFEARIHIRMFDFLGLSVTAPFGLYAPVGPNTFFFGNLAVGFTGGTSFHLSPGKDVAGPRLRVGGSFEAYAPTAPLPDRDEPLLAAAELAVAGLRSYEPFAYLPRQLSFRMRAHGTFALGQLFAGGLELGLIPGTTIGVNSQFRMWLSVAARASVHPIDEVEPFLEMGSALQIGGEGDYSPPFRLTPGVRFHFWTVDPALMVSFNFKEAKQIVFVVDIAGVNRPSRAEHEPQDRFWEQN